MEKKPELVMMVGLPGCGKSTYAKKMTEDGYQIVSSDEIRERTGETDNAKVFEILHKEVIAGLKNGMDMIYDATNMNRKKRMGFLKSIQHIPCKKRAFVFLIPLSICKEQNNMRTGKAKVGEHVYDKMLRSFQLPDVYEGFDEVKLITTSHNWKPSFSVEEMRSMPQDNPHHTLSLGEHLDKAHDYTVEHGAPWTVCVAAQWHDIGKVLTKQFKDKDGNPTEHAHYYGHENAGAYLYLTEIADLSLKDVHEEEIKNALEVAQLINWHMRPLNVWDAPGGDRAKERDEKLLGREMTEKIELLHQADLAAH